MGEVYLSSLKVMIEEWIWIIFGVNNSLYNLKRMYNPKNEKEILLFQQGFFQDYRLQSKFVIVVQLCKLFSNKGNTQKISFHKFINKLEHQKLVDDLEDASKRSSLPQFYKPKEFWFPKLEDYKRGISRNTEIIKKMEVWRDKYYAHTEIERKLPTLSLEELTTMIVLSKELFQDIRGTLFDIHFDFESNSEWKIDPIIREFC